MCTATVRHLALTLPRAVSAHGVQARLEDALRCAADDPRLLLLRRLSLGVLPSRGGRTMQADWAARTQTQLRAASAAALHAMAPGAEARDAVYFNDALEARILLIRLLAAGTCPIGWFWRLAVPEWDGAPWHRSAARLLRHLVARPGGTVALARAVRRLIAGGDLAVLLAPLTPSLVTALLPPLAGMASAPAASGPSTEIPEAAGAAPAAARTAVVIPAQARLVSAHASPVQAIQIRDSQWAAHLAAKRALTALGSEEAAALQAEFLRRSSDDPVVVWLAAQVVLERDPALASALVALIAVARALRAMVVGAAPLRAPPPGRRLAAPERTTPPLAERAVPRAEPQTISAGRKTLPQRADLEPVPALALEHPSEAAGLFFLVRPLINLSLPQWLDSHPCEALGAFGWALFAAIVTRMPVPASDPVWRLLPETDGSAEALTGWRVGLDRWLRRRTRVRLADVVRRPGWFTFSEDATLVRFPLPSADIRLRRHALDVDPGWVPWLGHAIHFAYNDHPLVGMGRA